MRRLPTLMLASSATQVVVTGGDATGHRQGERRARLPEVVGSAAGPTDRGVAATRDDAPDRVVLGLGHPEVVAGLDRDLQGHVAAAEGLLGGSQVAASPSPLAALVGPSTASSSAGRWRGRRRCAASAAGPPSARRPRAPRRGRSARRCSWSAHAGRRSSWPCTGRAAPRQHHAVAGTGLERESGEVTPQDVVAGVAAVVPAGHVDVVGPRGPNWSRLYPVLGARPLTGTVASWLSTWVARLVLAGLVAGGAVLGVVRVGSGVVVVGTGGRVVVGALLLRRVVEEPGRSKEWPGATVVEGDRVVTDEVGTGVDPSGGSGRLCSTSAPRTRRRPGRRWRPTTRTSTGSSRDLEVLVLSCPYLHVPTSRGKRTPRAYGGDPVQPPSRPPARHRHWAASRVDRSATWQVGRNRRGAS